MSENQEHINTINDENIISDITSTATNDEIIAFKLYGCVNKLKEFFSMERFVIEKSDPRSNIINLSVPRSYNIDIDDAEEMFDLLEKCRVEKCIQHISEKQVYTDRNESGIMIDIDRFQETNKDEMGPYINRFLMLVVRKLSEIVDLADPFHVFIIRKEKPEQCERLGKKCYKDGLHLLIPEIWISREAKKYLISTIRTEMNEVFIQISDSVEAREKMLDSNSASVPVFFVGSAKMGKTKAYPLYSACKIEYVDGGFSKTIIAVESLQMGILSIGNGKTQKINLVYELSLSFMLKTVSGAATWLNKRKYAIRGELEHRIQNFSDKPIENAKDDEELIELENSVNITCSTNAEAAYLKKLLNLLSVDYVNDYDKWINLLFAIANTNSGYKELARLFSMKSSKYSAPDFEKYWSDAAFGRHKNTTTKSLSIRSIVYWVQESSPDSYKSIREEYFYNIFSRLVYRFDGQLEHDHVAEVIHAMWKHKFVCVHDGDKRSNEFWYEFIMPGDVSVGGMIYKWRQDNKPIALENFIATKFQALYDKILLDIKKRIEGANTPEQGKYWVNTEKKIKESRRKLGNNNYIEGVIKRAATKFRHRDFLNEIDKNMDVIGVKNGILYLPGDSVKLIAAPHEFLVSKYIDVTYIPKNISNNEALELLEIFHNSIVENDAFEFLMYHASTGFVGSPAGMLMILRGSGANGKTFYLQMIQRTFGLLYAKPIPAKIFTSPPPDSEKPNPALMDLKGLRWGYCDETEENDVLNSNMLKVICSVSGQISGRKLNTGQEIFPITGNFVLATNFEPKLTSSDYGTLRRISTYTFKTKFSSAPDPNNKYEKLMNPKYMKEYVSDPVYHSAMLSIMIYYFENLKKLYGGDLMKVPKPTIVTETEKYRDNNDNINKFINQFMVKVNRRTEPLYISTIAMKYREWYDKNVGSKVRCYYDTNAIQLKLEESKLANLFTRNEKTKDKYLVGWVMRNYVGEEIKENDEIQTAEKDTTIDNLMDNISEILS